MLHKGKSHRTTFQLTLQTTMLQGEKQLNIIIKLKTSKLTFLTLFGGRVPYSKWVTLPTKWQVKTPIYSSGHMSITIDPESSKDGIFWPRMSVVMDGHCETALLITHCLVSKDTEVFQQILICNDAAVEVKLKLKFSTGIFKGHVHAELDSGLIIQLMILYVGDYVCVP